MTTKKPIPEKDVVISSGSAAASPKRATPPARAKRSATAAGSSVTPARAAETMARTNTFTAEQQLSHEEIARVAYAMWESRGRQGGDPQQDWLRAEEELRARTATA